MNQMMVDYAVVAASTGPQLPLRDAVVVCSAALGLAFLLYAVRCLCRASRSRAAS